MDDYMKKYPTPAEFNKMLESDEAKAKNEGIKIERGRILGLIDKEIEEWKEGKWWQDYNEGAVKSLTLLRNLVNDGVKKEGTA